MNLKKQIFLLGGIGCIAPYVIRYGVASLNLGAIPKNIVIIDMVMAGFVMFILSGILVTFVLNPNDAGDAFYKGVAIPALILSITQGQGVALVNSVDKLDTKPIETVSQPVNHTPSPGNSMLRFLSPSKAYADDGIKEMGTVVIDIMPQDVENIRIRIVDKDGNYVALGNSNTANFTFNYYPGSYTAIIETADYFGSFELLVEANIIKHVSAPLYKVSYLDRLTRGLKSIAGYDD